MPFRSAKFSQDLLRVVTDGDQPEAVLAKLFDATLQLHELRAAERSPIRGSDKHHHRAARTHDGLQIPRAAGLIREAEIRDLLPHLGAELRDVDGLSRRLLVLPASRERARPTHYEGQSKERCHPRCSHDVCSHRRLHSSQGRRAVVYYLASPFRVGGAYLVAFSSWRRMASTQRWDGSDSFSAKGRNRPVGSSNPSEYIASGSLSNLRCRR